MSKKELQELLKEYQASAPNSQLRRRYLRAFTPKMIYRTTKTEHPTTTKAMVQKVLDRL